MMIFLCNWWIIWHLEIDFIAVLREIHPASVLSQQSQQRLIPQQPLHLQVPNPRQWESLLDCPQSLVKTPQNITTTTTKLQGQNTKSSEKNVPNVPHDRIPVGLRVRDVQRWSVVLKKFIEYKNMLKYMNKWIWKTTILLKKIHL